MCLYPRLIKNRKYTANKKNGGVIPPILDKRTELVPVGCGNCMECRKQKSREWMVRINEEIRINKTGKFVTLTFSEDNLCKLQNEITAEGYELDNAIATLAVRRFLERWRKKFKTSLRHWLITELGHNGTERVHLHGIIWTTETMDTIEKLWHYGWIWKGYGHVNYVNERTINYITKYITKTDVKHKTYKSKILCSKGIGANYINRLDSTKNIYNGNKTNETYRTPQGHKLALPIYYRNKIYTEEQREKLWLQKLDKNERWVMGEKVQADNDKEYWGLLKHYRNLNKQLGYGTDEKDWNREQYERERRKLIQEKKNNN